MCDVTAEGPEQQRRPRVLMLGGWPALYDKALALDVELVVLGSASTLAELPADSRVRGVEADIMDAPACAALGRTLHAGSPMSAVVSFTEWGLESASVVAEALGVAANPLRPVRSTRDKLLMRRILEAAGMGTVRYRCCRTLRDAAAFLAATNGPVILKPAHGAGSHGVSFVADGSALPDAWRWTTEGTDDLVLAEEYLDGPEYSVEAVTFDGRHHVVAVTEKVTTGPPHFVELGHQTPARLPAIAHEATTAHVTSFLDLIGQRVGPTHTEVKIVPDGVRIIESQTRTGGDQIWELVIRSCGYDLHRATLEHLLTGRTTPARRPRSAAAIRFFAVEDRVVGRVCGVEAARRSPGVTRVVVTAVPGVRYGQLVDSRSRVGYVLAEGGTTAQAARRAEAAAALVTFTSAAGPAELTASP